MSKIKYYKNINLEEFLDEDIKEVVFSNNETNNKTEYNNEDFEDFEDLGIEIVEEDMIQSDITFDISKVKGKKKLTLVVNIYDNDEIIKLDFEIKKSTLKKLLKDLED